MPYLCVLIYFVFFAGVAMTIGEGLWNNAVNLLAIIVASVTAMCVGYPLGLLALEKFEKPADFAWYFTFAGVWLVFFATVMVFRIIAERLSRVRMKFVPPVEMAAGPLVGLLVAGMFASFLAFTLYTMPIKAGYWDSSKAAPWQITTMRTGGRPFLFVLNAVAGKAFTDASLGQ